MSRPFPPELLDHIVDNLHDQRAGLLACGVVSKSLVPRTRRHILAHVEFIGDESPIESWMKAFPDPSNPPAHYTQSLAIIGTQFVIAAGTVTGAGRWIHAFHNVVHLSVDTPNLQLENDAQISLVPLHGLSPTAKPLHMCSAYLPHTVFSVSCAPFLSLKISLWTVLPKFRPEEWETPLTSPRLTGSLGLYVVTEGISLLIHRLLGLSSGPNFRKVVLSCVREEDFRATMDLVSRCSGTIESFNVTDCTQGVFPSAAVLGRFLTGTIRPFQTSFVF